VEPLDGNPEGLWTSGPVKPSGSTMMPLQLTPLPFLGRPRTVALPC
jgi:hypothetical protein